jgi:hypothetical protein
MANPKVRPHLHFYPEDAGPRLSEARQGARWLNELPPELTTPWAEIEGRTYFTFEPAKLYGNRIVIPARWFMKDGVLHAQCWDVEVSDESGVSAWRAVLVDTPNGVRDISSADFLMPFPDLQKDMRERPQEYLQTYGAFPSVFKIDGTSAFGSRRCHIDTCGIGRTCRPPCSLGATPTR